MDQGIIASLLQHPLASALVILDRDGTPLAANPMAREQGLPAAAAAFRAQLEDIRLLAADGGIVRCSLPGGPQGRHDGWMRAAHDDDGQLLAFTLSIPHPACVAGDGHWELALDDAGHGRWDWDVPGDRMVCWPHAEDGVAGKRQDDACALLDHVHPGDRERVRAALQAHLRGEAGPYSAEYRLQQPGQAARWVRGRGRVVSRTADGQPLRMLGTHVDIERQKQLEAQVHDQQVQQHQADALVRRRTGLLNRVSALGRIGCCEIEVATGEMQWTEECCRIHGLREAPVSLDQALALYADDSRAAFAAALERSAAGGLPEQLDLCFYRPSGIRASVQALVEMDGGDGLPARVVVLFRDITRER